MGRFIQLVTGPAGVGKSTYCKTMQDHCTSLRRKIFVGNLDPAAENFFYDPAFDIRDLISIDDVMETLGYGPNGGLVYCMEHLLANTNWLRDELDNFGEDEYVILDCPGQIELYCHLPIMHELAKTLTTWGYRTVSVFILDSLSVLEPAKFISGSLLSLSCMLQLELPHINVITKCDIADKEQIEHILDNEGAMMISHNDTLASGKWKKLTETLGQVIDDFMIVSYIMLDMHDEDTVTEVLYRCDEAIQYGEDIEPEEPKEGENYENDNEYE